MTRGNACFIADLPFFRDPSRHVIVRLLGNNLQIDDTDSALNGPFDRQITSLDIGATREGASEKLQFFCAHLLHDT
jgi:hypothetical protein